MLPLYSTYTWVENVLNRVSEGGVCRMVVAAVLQTSIYAMYMSTSDVVNVQ